jgi:hypothetical protein
MKVFFGLRVVVFSGVVAMFMGSSAAHACSMQDMEAEVTKEIINVAVASLGEVELNNAISSNYRFSYTGGSGASCPTALIFDLQVDVEFVSGLNSCAVQLKVTKTQPFEGRTDADPVTYSILGHNTAVCRK